MSQFVKSIRTRIEELTASVETQTAELAAYKRILQLELAKESAPTEESPSEDRSQMKPISPQKAPGVELANITFTGNKTTLVGDIVRGLGSAGASPKDVDRVFTARKIKRSKNLIYNTLSYLVSQKKLQRRNGRYFGVGGTTVARSGGTLPAKRKISAAGLERIRRAVKKRWAAKRAADRAAAK